MARTATSVRATSCASRTPSDNRLRFVGGLFYQRQEHDIEQRYKIDAHDERLRGHRLGRHDLADRAEAHRRDYAVFGELSFDITDKLTATSADCATSRPTTRSKGFFGYGRATAPAARNGEALCQVALAGADDPRSLGLDAVQVGQHGALQEPRQDVKEDGYTPKVNLTYRFTDDGWCTPRTRRASDRAA